MGELYNPYPKLPKNIRQIGERDQIVKLYVEDYVNTYLKRLHPTGGRDLCVGLLLGSVETHEGTPYIFIDGAVEMEEVSGEGEKVAFTEQAWKKAYQDIEEMFPKRTIQGWFLCGEPGCQLSPLNYWKQHMQYFQGQTQLMYLNSGLEGEEAVYITSEDGFYKLRGHSIYYERNPMMQDYMVLRKNVHRVESGVNENVIRDFRQRMEERKEEAAEKRHTIGILSGLCMAMSIVILAGGIVMFNNYEKMREMEGVIASVMPQGFEAAVKDKPGSGSDPTVPREQGLGGTETGGIIVEEAGGEVYPTETETMAPTVPGETEAALTETSPPAPAPADQGAETQAASAGILEVTAGNQKVYTVGEGETLYGICLKVYHNLDYLQEICELNSLEDENMIISGQDLILP